MGIDVFQSVATFFAATKKLILGRSSSTNKLLWRPTVQQSPGRATPSLRKSLSRKMSFIPFLGKKRAEEEEEVEAGRVDEEGVWRRSILMGEKCDPLNFSGVIYYDSNGKRMSEIPRSPLRYTKGSSPLHALSFSIASSKAHALT